MRKRLKGEGGARSAALVSLLLTLEAAIGPGNGTEPVWTNLFFTVDADAVVTAVDAFEGELDLSEFASIAVQILERELSGFGTLNFIHGVGRLFDANFVAQPELGSKLRPEVEKFILELSCVEKVRQFGGSFVIDARLLKGSSEGRISGWRN
jgi:hypothetical protein